MFSVMKRFVVLLVCSSILSLHVLARADDGVKDIPPGDDRIVVVREGEKAPFTGQLFDQPTALRWSNWLLQYKLRLQVDADYTKKVNEADRKLRERKLEIEQEKYKTVTLDYQKQVATLSSKVSVLENELRNPPWYKSVWFGVVLGVVTASAAVGTGILIAR